MKQSKNVNDLLAAIQRKTPAGADPVEHAATIAESSISGTQPANKRGRVGHPVQFWMHEEDRRILRELSAWLAGQGVRASDSLVIRTALRSAKTGSELLQAYREAVQLDGRLKQSSEPSNSNVA
jgi:hypothetical protein